MPYIKGLVSRMVSKKNGRTYYFDKLGKFISKARYWLLNRARPGRKGRGHLTNKQVRQLGTLDQIEAKLTQQFKGPPKGGKSWVFLTEKYPQKFGAFL